MMRNLYLVQHGQAESKEVDPDRSLTDQGQRETEIIADMAAKLALAVDEIRHSGKTRAEQTATIIAQALWLQNQVVAISGLGPMDDVKPVASALAAEDRSVMLVGHLPFMARLAGYLIDGDADAMPIVFHNSGIVCLTPASGGWTVAWQLIPGS
ncbi:MAG: phosphohistidine phosphatase SixA [Anaerolineae bacterium]|nr:phosphohistidine phosphatase SixA [Anaerolineae bacterium]